MNIETLKLKIENKNAQDILNFIINETDLNIALASSLSLEDQILTDMLFNISSDAKIFTLDTGRLPEETYKLIEKTNKKYKTKLKIYYPVGSSVEKIVNAKGLYSFYNSIEDRKECCYARKIEPLKRALSKLDIWVTGLRKDQSITRKSIDILEWDENNNLLKLNPLANWCKEDVDTYINLNDIPYNELYDIGYQSIGCQPCSRAVKKQEDIRSGRWWWENPEHKECGLHIKD